MKTQEKLISGMQAAFPGESQASLARRAGLSVQRFNNYVTGIRTMDVDAVIGCAQALGWDIRETVAEHEIETAPTPRVKAYWRKLAGTAAMVLCAIGFAIGAIGASPKANATNGSTGSTKSMADLKRVNAYYVEDPAVSAGAAVKRDRLPGCEALAALSQASCSTPIPLARARRVPAG